MRPSVVLAAAALSLFSSQLAGALGNHPVRSCLIPRKFH
jgi:hypothetical protein